MARPRIGVRLRHRVTATQAACLPSVTAGAVTICYEYDALQRLTDANYSNGVSYHYEYDPVGNREKQIKTQNGVETTTVYEYDAANRLFKVNGVQYTYDNNGNLRSDGVTSYSYDTANRLVSASNALGTTTYAYNGLGDRLQESVNGVTTTFTTDLASGLTQTLDDGTHASLYGSGRTAQVNTAGSQYFLGDALGSVRQLTDAAGALVLAKSYDPYGVVTQTSGTGQSDYGYTDEYQSDLVYLRSRMYSTSTGRFLSRDTWGGDENHPMSYNAWLYSYSNPTRYTDPTGHFSESQIFSILNANTWNDVYGLFAENGIYQGMWGILDILRMTNEGDRLTAYLGSHTVTLNNPSAIPQFEIIDDLEPLGIARYVDGKFYLEKNGVMSNGLSILSNSKYKNADHLLLEEDVHLLNTTSYTYVYIYLSSTMMTKRYDSDKLDKTNISLDIVGLLLSIFGVAAPAKAVRAARCIQASSYIVGTVNAGYSLKVYRDWGGAGLSLVGAAPFPIVSIPASIGSLFRDTLPGVQP